MRRLMLGNAAVARGLFESGCAFVSSYPGTPSTEITQEAGKYSRIYAEWAPNEKVAMESAFFSSLSGRRSFCAMKHVGLNVAADPLFTISYTGVNAGFLVAVADDPAMHSSQNEQDSRHYAIAAKVPMLEPSDSDECRRFVADGYRISEKFDTPVIIRLCTRVAHSQSITDTIDNVMEIPVKEYSKDASKYVMMPSMAMRRHPLVEERMRLLARFAEKTPLNRIEKGRRRAMGIITSSACYNYVKEACGDTYPILKLGMINPMPKNLIRKFAESVKKVVVVEELDPVIENFVLSIGVRAVGKKLFGPTGELCQNIVREKLGLETPRVIRTDADIPPRPPALCSGCPHRGVFHILSKLKLNVIGDIGCYTLGANPPLRAMDTTICMGASVSGLHGFVKLDHSLASKSVAVIGDSTFMHSGITGLVNMACNDSAGTVIILDNSTTGMTGHQDNPTTGRNLKGDPCVKVSLEDLCKAVGVRRVRVADPYDLKGFEDALKEELAAGEPSVIISRRPCVLLKGIERSKPLIVDKDKCIGCKSCMKIGCPSLSIKESKAVVDRTQCVGCAVCAHLCPTSALEVEK